MRQSDSSVSFPRRLRKIYFLTPNSLFATDCASNPVSCPASSFFFPFLFFFCPCVLSVLSRWELAHATSRHSDSSSSAALTALLSSRGRKSQKANNKQSVSIAEQTVKPCFNVTQRFPALYSTPTAIPSPPLCATIWTGDNNRLTRFSTQVIKTISFYFCFVFVQYGMQLLRNFPAQTKRGSRERYAASHSQNLCHNH